MNEPWIARTSQLGKYDRFELHLCGKIHALSLEQAEKLAREILGLLDIEVAQLETVANAAKDLIRSISSPQEPTNLAKSPVAAWLFAENLREELGKLQTIPT